MIWLLLGCAPELAAMQRSFEEEQPRSFADCGVASLPSCPEAEPPEQIQCVLEQHAAGQPLSVVLQSPELQVAVYWLGAVGEGEPRLVQLQRAQGQAWRTDCADLGEWQENPANGCTGLAIVGPCEQQPL